ncbi:MAG TPA: hypothetical protein PKC18_13385, partial [Lacipirellulaceae bacterium]|nr:hypothetical protein [Lacipirellulaceae bacterium]
MHNDRTLDGPPPPVAPYSQEALLIDALPQMSGQRILCTSPGLAQFAVAAAGALPDAIVTCTYLDLYRATLAVEAIKEPSPT